MFSSMWCRSYSEVTLNNTWCTSDKMLFKRTCQLSPIERHWCGFKWRHFCAADVNDVWPQDQHDKWGQFHLWLPARLEAFLDEINWLKIWWINKNPRLIVKSDLNTCWRIDSRSVYPTLGVTYDYCIVGILIITQSDPGTENNGVANAHIMIWQCLDPNLANTLQHHFTTGHNKILSEIKWSVFCQDFSPDFKDMNGWYDVNNTLEKWVQSYLCYYTHDFLPFRVLLY